MSKRVVMSYFEDEDTSISFFKGSKDTVCVSIRSGVDQRESVDAFFRNVESAKEFCRGIMNALEIQEKD